MLQNKNELCVYSAQSVDAWVSYVRTRESILAKHYDPDSLILAGCVGEPRCRALLDTLLASLEPLKLLPFSLDLMFEMRELHRSFKKIESDMRAASRVSQDALATRKTIITCLTLKFMLHLTVLKSCLLS